MTWSLEFPSSVNDRGYEIADGSQTGLDLSGDFTIEWWQLAPTTNSTTVVVKEDATDDYSYFIYWWTSGELHISVKDSTGAVQHTREWTPSLTAGTWYHFAITFDVSGAVGVQYEMFMGDESTAPTSQGNGTLVSGGVITSVLDGDGRFALGVDHLTVNTLEGEIMDVRVWSDIRTLSEIQDNHDERLDGTQTNLEANWLRGTPQEMADLETIYSSVSITDATANANDLTFVGTGLDADEFPFILHHWPDSYSDTANETRDVGELFELPTMYTSTSQTLAQDGEELQLGDTAGAMAMYSSTTLTARENGELFALGGVGSGIGQLYRMRANDGTLSRQVYWTATLIDTGGIEYTGPGPLTDIVISEIIGD